MGNDILAPVTGPAAWRGDELAREQGWIYRLCERELDELETVGARFLRDDPDLRYVAAEEYPLPETAAGLAAWQRDMDEGRGFVLVRGLRTDLYSDALSASIFYLLGLHIGEPIRQNELGDTFDHVRANTTKTVDMVELGDTFDHVRANTTKTVDDPSALGSRTTDRLSFHSDSSDVVALMCLRTAPEGGASILMSGATIYNELLARRPDLAPLMFEPWYWDWYKQDHDAPQRYYVSPMASMVDGVFSIYAGSRMIRSAQDYPEVPRLTAQQLELLDVLDEIFLTPGLPIEMDFRPGDIQWLLNYTALHSRTAYRDYPEPERKRHLMRLWLKRSGRPLVEGFGKNVVLGRAEERGEPVPADLARFRISRICYPRHDWGLAAA